MKRSKPIYIRIPKPCHENWEEMTINDKGRHCTHCDKTVVDLTALSDAELLDFISKQNGRVCGRFHRSQLNRQIVVPPQPASRLYRMMIACSLSLIFAQLPEAHAGVKQPTELLTSFEEDKAENTTITRTGATIEVHVTTSERRFLEDAIVLLQQDDTVIQLTNTNSIGVVLFEDIPPGTYDVYIKCDPTGFIYVRQIHERIKIGAADTIEVHACIAKEEPVRQFIMGDYDASYEPDELTGRSAYASYYGEMPLGSYQLFKVKNKNIARKE